jgi:hypothetical protein
MDQPSSKHRMNKILAHQRKLLSYPSDFTNFRRGGNLSSSSPGSGNVSAASAGGGCGDQESIVILYNSLPKGNTSWQPSNSTNSTFESQESNITTSVIVNIPNTPHCLSKDKLCYVTDLNKACKSFTVYSANDTYNQTVSIWKENHVETLCLHL